MIRPNSQATFGRESMAEKDRALSDAPVPRRRFFHRWMLGALCVATLTGVPSALWYRSYDERWQHRPPKSATCSAATALKAQLEKPAIVSPSEPFPLSEGETVYLTAAQFRAVKAASSLPNQAAQRLAAAYGQQDPEEQARALSAALAAARPGPEGDLEALGLWCLIAPSMQGLPEGPVREAAAREVDELVGCRFEHPKLPGCASRPPLPVGMFLLAGTGGFALCLILASLLQSTLGGRPLPPPAKK